LSIFWAFFLMPCITESILDSTLSVKTLTHERILCKKICLLNTSKKLFIFSCILGAKPEPGKTVFPFCGNSTKAGAFLEEINTIPKTEITNIIVTISSATLFIV